MFAALLLAAAAISPPAPSTTVASVQDVANSAALCLLSAGKNGVDRSRFSEGGWTKTEESGVDYRHQSAPVTIEMPADSDGVQRICVVRAMLFSQASQDELADELSRMLKTRPFKQSDSMIWMVSMKTPRGIQLFIDKDSPKPNVRLIGAEF